MGKKRNYYFPPKTVAPKKKTPEALQVDDEVKEKLNQLAEELVETKLQEEVDRRVKEHQDEDLNNYLAFTVEALSRLGWTGPTRLNRFLCTLITVSSEAADSDDPVAYAQEIKERFTEKGVVAFKQNDDATPQMEGVGV